MQPWRRLKLLSRISIRRDRSDVLGDLPTCLNYQVFTSLKLPSSRFQVVLEALDLIQPISGKSYSDILSLAIECPKCHSWTTHGRQHVPETTLPLDFPHTILIKSLSLSPKKSDLWTTMMVMLVNSMIGVFFPSLQ